ncbi:uncharacterized protein LOC121386240 isoform X2 [Gigantopelta aegis]|uniref:uncharacterized protein LOC121386240 isoform X2 n=1 Tax=Gigantopelta aegis TaxID=1735272 RepID=UPI001B88D146|nr:uncharacterized protein LOC121386240 isoform X2 [Gigantopelta aegis]
MLALTMCVKQKSAARSSLYYPESQHFNRTPHRPDQLSSFQPYRSPEAARRPTTDVCVVGFYTETSRTHLKSVRDICTASATGMQVRVEVTGFTVHRHEDLGSIPLAKVYVMFVDFNERNVILEDPRKGLGDLRLLTVCSLWALGVLDSMMLFR